jgi:predicted AlkP superfamily phosphohydrolase/phosphomutase
MGRKVAVLGLDGTPFTFAQNMMAPDSPMPNFARLLQSGCLRRMRSTHPDISGVAWSSFMTGKNPAKHGIFGFIDRKPGTYQTFIPNSTHMQGETIYEIAGKRGLRVCSLGVPNSFPPRPINGAMVGCFLSPSVERATYPPELAQELKGMGYKVDTDPWAARESTERFLEDFRATLKTRGAAILKMLRKEPWDLFVAHIIETDRLHHFLWGNYEHGDEKLAPAFVDCYRQVDEFIGRFVEAVPRSYELIVLSDHGSCAIKQEVYLAHWLMINGYLKFTKEKPESMDDIDASSKAYVLDPGRIFINLQGREPRGSVAPGEPYDRLRSELAEAIQALRDPDDDSPIVKQVHFREDIYNGSQFSRAPDLLVETYDGYDVKGSISQTKLLGRGPLTGMHTFDDAMFFLRGDRQLRANPGIVDVPATILSLLDIPVPSDMDGQPCLVQ